MKILIACEFSQVVTDQIHLLDAGHDILSCDLESAEKNYFHYQGNVLELMKSEIWDLMIAFPPCTHLAVSGARHFPAKIADGRQQAGIDFFMKMVNAPIPKIAIENPVGIMSTIYKPPTQYIQPFQFGEPYKKKTGLWLKNLPKLKPTNIVSEGKIYEWIDKNGKKKRMSWFNYESFKLPTKERAKFRNRFPVGIAKAMAEQWT